MTQIKELKSISNELVRMRLTVPKSRNRHREVNESFLAISDKIDSIATELEKLLESCDTNMTLFESLIELYERGHVTVNQKSPADIQEFTKDLFGTMRSLIASYEQAKEHSTSDDEAE